MWFLARMYNAEQALQMGLVNTVVPLDRLETETLVWCFFSSYYCSLPLLLASMHHCYCLPCALYGLQAWKLHIQEPQLSLMIV